MLLSSQELINNEWYPQLSLRFLHPLHNFALVSYNPMDLPPEARSKVRAAPLAVDPPIQRGDSLHLVRGQPADDDNYDLCCVKCSCSL